MASSPATSERPSLQGIQRPITSKARALSLHEKAGLEKADATADILYTHPNAKIISFSPPNESIKSSSTAPIPEDTDYPIDTIETLPWRSRTEVPSAAGSMVIEKVRGSTNFLKCQSIMHAIMKNSQCWCVDGESKFVLRVRKFQYYRIELPRETDEDKRKVEELKSVLPTVLRFERTPCPFKRGFTVELPDDAITPRRKGQWKRRDSSQPGTPEMESPTIVVEKNARSWSMRAPPSSYPRRGPAYGATTVTRSRSPSTSSRRESAPGKFISTESSNQFTAEPGLESESIHTSSVSQVDAVQNPIDPSGEDSSEPTIVDKTQTGNQNLAGASEQRGRPRQTHNADDHSTRDHPNGSKHNASYTVDASTTSPSVPYDKISAASDSDMKSEIESASAKGTINEGGSDVMSSTADGGEIDTNSLLHVDEHGLEPPQSTIDSTISQGDLDSSPNVDHPLVDHLHTEEALEDHLNQHDLEAITPTGLTRTPELPVLAPQYVPSSADTVEDFPHPLTTVSSIDSFHTLSSDYSSVESQNESDLMTPLARDSVSLGPVHQHKRGISEVTVKDSIPGDFQGRAVESQDSIFDQSSGANLEESNVFWGTPPPTEEGGIRQRLRARRSFSPLPPPSTIFSGHNSNHDHSRDTIKVILQKAIVKPIEVVVLVIHVLARIAGGATVSDLLSGELFRNPEHRRVVSGFADQSNGNARQDDSEDDFGVPIRGRLRHS